MCLKIPPWLAMKRIIDLIPIEVKHLNIGLSLESPLKPYERMKFTSIERMKFTSIEDAKNDYTRYAKIKGFSFCMGCITKSRTNGMIIGQEIVCSKEESQAKKYAERENRSLVNTLWNKGRLQGNVIHEEKER